MSRVTVSHVSGVDLVGLDAGAHDGLRLEAGLHLVLDGEVDDARQVDQGDRGEHRHGQAHEESEADGSLPGPHALHILAHGLSWPGREVTRLAGARLLHLLQESRRIGIR